ncbi:MAG TPA: RICIN domain-containing protein [Acidobacteriaceae bacterium]|nr:RICIN domain-containing protein [Acidobacteriaceae bacterium]
MSKIHSPKFLFLALLIAAVGVLSPHAEAQQTPRTDAVYNGWISAYQVADGSNFFIAKSLTDRSDGFWSEGYGIFEAEDAYFQDHSASRYTQIVQLLNDFLTKNGNNWGGDSWDDDLEWIIYAYIRGYQMTGNTAYLTAAANNWNLVYSRGWDSTFGGGIWEENSGRDSKCILSNGPFVIEGVLLYRATGTSTYLTESEQAYEWVRNNLFNYTNTTNAKGVPGQADECIHASGLAVSDNVYNTGLIVNAANSLYRETLSSEYYGDVQLAASHVMSKWPIMSASNPDNFFRGIAAFATQNNLWSTYNTYVQNNANAAWNERRTDYNITNNNWTVPTTTTGNIVSMDSGASITVQAVLPVSFSFSGNYEILCDSGLVLDVSGGSTSGGAAVVQTAYTGATNQLWTFVSTAGGYFQIKNVKSGLVLNVKGHSTTSGALIQQYGPQGMQPGNDEWMPALNSDGTYSFYNLNSNMALEIFGSTSGTQFEQNFANNNTDQKFTLIKR